MFSSTVDAHALDVHPAVRDVLLDQLVCSRAGTLLLNAYSTFSQLVMGRIGLDAPAQVGWTRELSSAVQKRLGVRVRYWMREQFVKG